MEIKILDFYPSHYGIIPYTFMPFNFSNMWFAMYNKKNGTGHYIYDLLKKSLQGGLLPKKYWTEEQFKGSLIFPNKYCEIDLLSWEDLVRSEYGSVPSYSLYARNENGDWVHNYYGLPIFQFLIPKVFSNVSHGMSKRKLKSLNTDGRRDCASCGETLTSIKGMGFMFNHCTKCEG